MSTLSIKTKIASKCKKLIVRNGWKYDVLKHGGSGAYNKEGLCSIDFDVDEIVLLDDTGDFLHLPMNYYALVGALIEYRQLAINYLTC